MDYFRIQGGKRLAGRVKVDGSKNAALPLLAAVLLTDQTVTLHNVPALTDISNMISLLRELGVEVKGESGTVTLRSVDETQVHTRYEIVSTMRASISVLGPMLARRHRAVIAMPGGCAFGERPIDLHLRGMQSLGAKIELNAGDMSVTAPQLKGTTIFLGGPNGSTVLGTANVMCAATLAEGRTTIECAACEPEVVDLANMLIKMGAKIRGAGSPRIIIEGVKELGGAEYTVMPDRIVAGTYAVAAAVTNGDIIIDDFPFDCMLAVVDRFDQIGVVVDRLDFRKLQVGVPKHHPSQEHALRLLLRRLRWDAERTEASREEVPLLLPGARRLVFEPREPWARCVGGREAARIRRGRR